MTVFRASYWIPLCNCGFLTVFLLCEDRESPSHFLFLIINFVDSQFRGNLSVFAWHQNYGFFRDREMKIILLSPKRRSSGLPDEFFYVTVGFQWSSYCVKTVEVRHTRIFSRGILYKLSFAKISGCFLGTKFMASADIAN